MIRISYLARAALGLAVIVAFLGWMTVRHEQARSSGTEVVLQTYPIDPRDVFFGHYATLGYRDFNTSDMWLSWPVEAGLEAGDLVYFTLTASGPFHQPGESFATLDEAAAQGGPVLKAELFEGYGVLVEKPEAFQARFDLPRQYFADPETALALQDDFQTATELQRQRDNWEHCRDLQQSDPERFEQAWMCEDFDPANEPTADIPEYGVILSVSDTGEAVIKGLYLDGERVMDTLRGPRLVRERSE
jgi:hypothetical protein